LPIRAYEIFIFTGVSNVKQWKCVQYNGGVGSVVCIAGMVEGSGSMVGIIVVIISGTDNAGMHCIKVFIQMCVNQIVKLIWQRVPITT
jgi:hypothetical protein